MAEILVDILKVKDLYSGLGQFSVNFARAMAKANRPVDRIHFLSPAGFNVDEAKGVSEIHPSLFKRYFPGLNKPFDLWHSLHQFPSYLPNPRSKWVLTVHDLNFLVEKGPAKAKRYLHRLQKNIDQASAVTAISQFTRSQLEEHVDLKGKQVHVIHNGVVIPTGDPGAKPARPYFLSLGVFKKMKNFYKLVPMMEEFPDHDLVLVGNNATAYGAEVRKQIHDLGLEARVLMPGEVSEQEKFRLYTHCDGFLLPSQAEGFGLPVIEAMLLGKPVFLSNSSSLPEVGGELAYYFNSLDPGSMANIIRDGLKHFASDPVERGTKIKGHALQFTWDACIAKYLELYAEILA